MKLNNDDYLHFACIVVGENHEELLAKYDKNLKTEPYVVYKYSDAIVLKDRYIQVLEGLLPQAKNPEEIKEVISEFKIMNPYEFFEEYTKDYQHDSNTGDAISNTNKNGKWSSHQIGKVFSVPFMLKDGSESFSAKVKDIDWPKVHHFNTELYKVTWELCMEDRIPKTDVEKNIWNNMHERINYFNKFETKENYIESCTAFWAYAFLSEKTGWVELEPEMDQFTWMNTFYDKFIKPLDGDTLLTIYECKK